MPTDLYLIRHGESVPNVEPIIGGMQGDAGLTDLGRSQAGLLEDRLRRGQLHADRLYASTLPRAVETAEYVARGLRLPVAYEDDLQELRPGEADGLSFDQWRTRYGSDLAELDRDPFRPLSPGGESWAAFLVRAGAMLARLVARHEGESVVAVCHGGVLEAAFYLAFGLGGTHRMVRFAPLNTSISHWRHRSLPGGGQQWTLAAFNDAAHLSAESLPSQSAHEAVPTVDDQG